jgi:hypothetical protein
MRCIAKRSPNSSSNDRDCKAAASASLSLALSPFLCRNRSVRSPPIHSVRHRTALSGVRLHIKTPTLSVARYQLVKRIVSHARDIAIERLRSASALSFCVRRRDERALGRRRRSVAPDSERMDCVPVAAERRACRMQADCRVHVRDRRQTRAGGPSAAPRLCARVPAHPLCRHPIRTICA